MERVEEMIYWWGVMGSLFFLPWMLFFINYLYPTIELPTTIMFSAFGLFGMMGILIKLLLMANE